MWQFIIIAVVAVFSAGSVYVSFRGARFAFVQKLARGKKTAARLICFAAAALVTGVLALLLGIFNALVCMLHLYVFWLLADLIGLAINKARKKTPSKYIAGAFAVLFCIGWMTYGWFSAHCARQTFYSFETAKVKENVRIVQVTDSHIGQVFDSAGFAKYMEDINALSPDAVVIVGDFVDDDTSKEDMLGGCDALGKLQTRYGVYFAWGNHDRGYYSESRRGWSYSELRARLEANGVIILEDDTAVIADSICLIGRKDRSDGRRKTAAELMQTAGKDKYTVMLDHQPHDFAAEAETGVDLVLCGHTHGGQFIPILHVGEWIGENDLRYGHEKRGDTDFIVSSGIGCWGFKFKTGCFSEYVIIDIKPAAE
ncbi:MAG: metallophosphoesterase [Clostridia bacterium]|nr:metallophosphoesterase [Clostridia bacterium]